MDFQVTLKLYTVTLNFRYGNIAVEFVAVHARLSMLQAAKGPI